MYAFDDAMQATLSDAAKFDRLAARLGQTSADAKARLRKRFRKHAERVHQFRTRTSRHPYALGPGRHDAIGLIITRVTAIIPQIPQNWSDAARANKASFPLESPQGLWTQWRGVQQDPIFRNVVETMGVFLPIDLTSKSPPKGCSDPTAAVARPAAGRKPVGAPSAAEWPEEYSAESTVKRPTQAKRCS